MRNPSLRLAGTFANLCSAVVVEEQHDNIGLGAQMKHRFQNAPRGDTSTFIASVFRGRQLHTIRRNTA